MDYGIVFCNAGNIQHIAINDCILCALKLLNMVGKFFSFFYEQEGMDEEEYHYVHVGFFQ